MSPVRVLVPICFSIVLASTGAPDQAIRSWAKTNGYREVQEEKGEVLLYVRSGKGHSIERKVDLIRKTLEAVDRYLPAAAGGTSGPPLQVMELRDMEHMKSLRKVLESNWLSLDTGRDSNLVGFVLADPLLGVWVREVPGQEEWNPDNELVNRLAQLEVLRRAGRLPYWLEMGIAWNVEMSVCGGIYCFPYRAGFVRASEHTGWLRRLKNRMKDTRRGALGFDALPGWSRGTFDPDAALLAWGMVRFLAEEHAQSLPALLREMSDLRETLQWKRNPDGSRSTVAGFELGPADQRALLEKRIGPDFFEQAVAWIRKAK